MKKNIRTKTWWIKLGVALVISNLFFFILFSKNEKPLVITQIPSGWVEIQIQGELLTPYENQKKVLLIQRKAHKKVLALLRQAPPDPLARFTVLVKEEEAPILLDYQSWEIVPYLKSLHFVTAKKGVSHEIRY